MIDFLSNTIWKVIRITETYEGFYQMTDYEHDPAKLTTLSLIDFSDWMQYVPKSLQLKSMKLTSAKNGLYEDLCLELA